MKKPRAWLLLIDFLLATGTLLLSPVLLVRVLLRERWRRGLSQRLALSLPSPRGDRPRVWVHGASAGEMVAVIGLVEAWRRARPDLDFVLSSATTAGVDVAARRFGDDLECFVLPLDLGPAVRRVLRRVDPERLVLVELELWPNLVWAAADRGVDVVVANGRVGETTARRVGGDRLGAWLRRLLGFPVVRAWAVQNEEVRDRLLRLGIPDDRITRTGNLKVDAARADAPSKPEVRRGLGYGEEDRVVVAGSTHPGEEALVGAAWAALRAAAAPGSPPLRLVVAPRHGERLADAERNLQDAGLSPVRLTSLRRGDGRRAAPESTADTVLVDTMGELAELYAAADLAIVGGSLVAGIGGHNVFEPVLAGAPTLIGAHHGNVRSDVLWLEAAGALKVVPTGDALLESLRASLDDGGTAAEAARRALDGARGAATKTIRTIELGDASRRRHENGLEGTLHG